MSNEFEEFRNAWKDLLKEIDKSFKITKFLNWSNSKLESKKNRLILYIIVVATFTFLLFCEPCQASQTEHLINTIRSNAGVHEVIESNYLNVRADKRAKEVYNNWSHEGYEKYSKGEVLAKNHTFIGAFRAWYNSRIIKETGNISHYDNLIKEEYWLFGYGKFRNIRVIIFQ